MLEILCLFSGYNRPVISLHTWCICLVHLTLTQSFIKSFELIFKGELEVEEVQKDISPLSPSDKGTGLLGLIAGIQNVIFLRDSSIALSYFLIPYLFSLGLFFFKLQLKFFSFWC